MRPASRPIGVGIVGCGELARQGVLPHLAQPDALPRVRVAAVCGRTLDRAQELGQRYHIPHATADYDALLADGEVEAVLILTPARLHYSQALAAVRAGKHVYVQKPMTETLQEALILEREVQRHGVVLVPAPVQALNPLIGRLQELIRDGAIGTPFWVHAPAPAWAGREIEYGSNPAWHFREGAGPFRDRGVYALSLLLELFGPVRRVTAMQTLTAKRRSWGERPFMVTAPDNVVAQLELGEGVLASLGAHWCAAGPRAAPFQIGIYGLEGSLESSGYLGAWPVQFELRRLSQEPLTVALDPAEVPELSGPHAQPVPHVWADLLHLLDCIREGTEPRVGVTAGRQVVEILNAVERAAETGETQEIGRQ